MFGKDPNSQEIAALWKSANEVDDYGISVFQRNIETIIETNLRTAGRRLQERTIEGKGIKHIAASAPELDLNVEIFRDHMRVKNVSDNSEAFCVEWFDDLVPNDHYDAADEFFKDKIAINEGRFPRSE